jgi:hypothetical protein
MGTETLLATTGQIFMRLLELHGIDAEQPEKSSGYLTRGTVGI